MSPESFLASDNLGFDNANRVSPKGSSGGSAVDENARRGISRR